MGFAGRLQVLFGFLASFGIMGYRVEITIGGVVGVFIGIGTVSAASALRNVSRRSGDDIQHLVGAATNLKNAFRLQIVLFLLIGFVTIASVTTAGNWWSA